MRLRFFIFVAIIFSAVPRVSISDENPYDFNYSFDNDYPFSVLNDDRAYSGGQRLSLIRTTDRLPIVFRFLEWFTSNSSQFNSGFALGQQLYTPDDISRRDPIEDDEPYAAYLSGSFLSYLRNENTLHLFQVELGVVGPLALGENIQNAIHRFIGYRIAEGWDNQLKTEPILNLFYQQKRTFWALKDAKGVSLSDFVPNAAIAAGNLYVYGQVGAQFRLGYGLSDDFGPTMTTPMSAEPFVPEQRQPWEAYGFLAADFRYMVRNLFLDGNTFQTGPRIDKRALVYDLDFGFLFRYQAFRIAWRQVLRSQEFQSNLKTHGFGSVLISYTHNF